MEDQAGALLRLKTESDGAAKSIDALAASLAKMAGVKIPDAASKDEQAFKGKVKDAQPSSKGSAGASGDSGAKDVQKNGAAQEKAQAKIDESAAKTAMQRLKQKQNQELKAIEGHEKAVTDLKKVHQKQRLALVKQSAEATISDVSGNLQTLAGHHKAFGSAAKAAMIADATMKTYNSAIGAYDQAMSLPRPLGLIMGPVSAAMAVGAGLANISKISGQKFEQGGPVIGPSHAMGGVMAELEGGEYVVPRRTVNKMGGFQAVEGTLGIAAASRPSVSSVLNISVKGRSGTGPMSGSANGGGKSLIASMRGHQNKSRLAGAYRITG